MKKIFLLRHAKSSWDDYSLRDFDRPLAKRGLKDAPRMGRFFRKLKLENVHIVSSPAKRAKQTTELFFKSANIDPENITWEERLYYGDAAEYLTAVQAMDNEKTNAVVLVGHNPMLENAAAMLCNSSQHPNIIIPTAALAMFTAHIETWQTVKMGICELNGLITPKIAKKLMK